MPTVTVQPDHHLQLRYRVPRSGVVEYHVEAERPVTTFVVDEEGLREFMDEGGEVGSYYGGFARRYRHDEEVRFPFRRGWWYLVIVNNESTPVAVHYEVSA